MSTQQRCALSSQIHYLEFELLHLFTYTPIGMVIKLMNASVELKLPEYSLIHSSRCSGCLKWC